MNLCTFCPAESRCSDVRPCPSIIEALSEACKYLKQAESQLNNNPYDEEISERLIDCEMRIQRIFSQYLNSLRIVNS